MTAQTILPANSVSDTAFNSNSCRFDGTGAYMSKTPGSDGDAQKMTTSIWFKRGVLGRDIRWFEMGDLMLYSGSNIVGFANRAFDFDVYTESNFLMDTAAWYHIVWSVDTTQSTAANRVKIYVNGVLLTSANGLHADTSYMDQNANLECNQQEVHRVGAASNNANDKFDGYMSEFVHIDGAQLAPTSFGESDSDSGIWVPIDVSGLTFGNNGYYLNFKNASNLGNDANGGTDFTESNLAATDQGLDTCTNNFATMNTLVKSAATLSEGNLKQATAGKSSVATIGVTSGKWYFEQKFIGSGVNEATLGFALEGSGIFTNDVGGNTVRGTGYVTLYVYDGKIYNEGTATSSFATFAVNDIIGWNLDADAGDIFLYRNGSILNSGSAVVSGKTGKTWFPFGNFDTGDVTGVEHNFGGARTFSISSAVADGNGFGAFEFAPKSGHLAICTKNLAENG